MSEIINVPMICFLVDSWAFMPCLNLSYKRFINLYSQYEETFVTKIWTRYKSPRLNQDKLDTGRESLKTTIHIIVC